MNATHRISKARTTLLLDHPFFGALLYRLKPVPNNRQPTMATDGVSLFYNDNFVEDLAPAELVGVLAHEVMHPALKHHVRRGDRNPRVWNIACDYAINPLLVDAGLHLPKGILLDNSYRGMSAEAIYNRIAQEQEDGSAGQGKDGGQGQEPGQTPGQRPVETPGGFGQVMDAPNPEEPGQTATPAQISQQEQQWSEATTQAAAISRMAGKVPLGADRAIEGAAEAKVDWREHLRRTFSEAAFPADYSWSRPNRRFAHAGLFLPSVQKEGVGELVVAVDCSGSISDRILGVFQAEVQALVDFAALVGSAGLIVVFLAIKIATKFIGILPLTRAFRFDPREGMYTTLLMSTGLTFGSISALFGLTNHIIDQGQYTVLVTAVIGSAVVPTLIAQRWFLPALPDAADLAAVEATPAEEGAE